MKKLIGLGLAGAVALTGLAGTASAEQKTIDTVKARGMVNCGVSTGNPGFSNPDDKGKWSGFDVDFCRAVAAAVLNDADKVSYKPLTAKERFTALQSGEIDILSRTTTWTLSRDSAMGLAFAGITFYDGQGFIVKKSLGVKAAKDLNGATVCVQTGTTTELNLADYFRTTKMKAPDDNVVLPDIISKEPLGPVVRQGDFQWFTLVKWVYYGLLNAEELGIAQANVEEMTKSTNPEILRVLGKEGEFGKAIGLENDWIVRIVKSVGNYGEIYERHVGEKSPLKIARGVNNLWTKGGLQYAPPIR